MENTSQAQDLVGIHYEMHGIAKQIRIMNGINAHLVQHLSMNNLAPVIAPIPEDVGRYRHSHRSGNLDSQNCQSAS